MNKEYNIAAQFYRSMAQEYTLTQGKVWNNELF